MQIYDLAFIGSGLSSSATLYHLLSGLQKNNNTQDVIKIAVIEKHHEFWKGIPYGSRSSVHSMTINPVKDFLEDAEKPVFINWVKKIQAANWPGVSETQRTVLNKWFERTVNKDIPVDTIYLPRFLYGLYLSQKLESIIADCNAKNIIKLDLITGEAIGVDKNDKSYIISIDKGDEQLTIATKTMILATGSLDTRYINTQDDDKHLCINDIYYPALEQNFETIINQLKSLPAEKRKVLVIGSNASASEIIHLLGKYRNVDDKIVNKITVLSNSGRLPELLHVHHDDYGHLMHSLNALAETGQPTADELIDAIEKDVAAAMANNYTMGQIYYSLGDRAVKLQQMLSPDEQLKFFNEHGWTLTRITRRTSEDYHFTEQDLIKDNLLEFIKGRFVELTAGDRGDLPLLINPKIRPESILYTEVFPVVINCIGAEDITTTASSLIKSLFNNGICRINHNGMGIAVNEDFMANEGCYIIGPLLAGIYNSKYKFWHLENAKRLNSLGATLANTLVAKVAG